VVSKEIYFSKCFCFSQKTKKPGENLELIERKQVKSEAKRMIYQARLAGMRLSSDPILQRHIDHLIKSCDGMIIVAKNQQKNSGINLLPILF